MHLLFALAISVVAACGIYLLLSRHLVRVALGLTLLSAATNLVLFFAGRIVTDEPPLMRASETVLPETAANALPQALILTAIVIGFSLIVFFAALALRAQRIFGTVDLEKIDAAERAGSPFHPEPGPR